MPMKLMVCVRPGVELTCASFCPSRELIKLDFPTLERPRKANSGGPSAGKNLGSAAEVRNLARMGFMQGNKQFNNLQGLAADFRRRAQILEAHPHTLRIKTFVASKSQSSLMT